MSHFSKIKTTLKDLSLLQKSLNDLGVSWNENISTIKGYKAQECFANLVIKQNNNYDIGFTWNGTEYQLVADLQFWQQPWSVELFLDKIVTDERTYFFNAFWDLPKILEMGPFLLIEAVSGVP